MKNGGHILAQALFAHGVKRIFSVAGESYLPLLDGLLDYPDIDVITCRQESGVTFMAEADANLTGRAGVALVTRAPGACNASIGIHAAKQSSTPLVMFVGLINSADRDKEAFQEFDLPQMFGSISKWAFVIDRAERIPEYVARAFHVAQSGRPGPVVVGLPEDILFPVPERAIPDEVFKPYERLDPALDPQSLSGFQALLQSSEKPVIIAGDGGWDDNAAAALQVFSQKHGIAVSCAFRRQDAFDNAHPNYIGDLEMGTNPALIKHVQDSDLVIAIGTRLDETTVQSYNLFKPGQRLAHIHPCPSEFGKGHRPDLAITANARAFLDALNRLDFKTNDSWGEFCARARKDYEAWTAIPAAKSWSGADMTQVIGCLRDHLPADAIVTTDAGNFSGWCRRYIRYGRPGRLLAPVCGAMGYGVPAAVAASLHDPDRLVVGFCGDGGFMMSAQELATAVHHGAAPVIIVCNNNMFGTIRMHQEREYPGRHSATFLTNPDFVTLAESYGARGYRITDEKQFPDVWQSILKDRRLTLIEIRMDRKQITTRA